MMDRDMVLNRQTFSLKDGWMGAYRTPKLYPRFWHEIKYCAYIMSSEIECDTTVNSVELRPDTAKHVDRSR